VRIVARVQRLRSVRRRRSICGHQRLRLERTFVMLCGPCVATVAQVRWHGPQKNGILPPWSPRPVFGIVPWAGRVGTAPIVQRSTLDTGVSRSTWRCRRNSPRALTFKHSSPPFFDSSRSDRIFQIARHSGLRAHRKIERAGIAIEADAASRTQAAAQIQKIGLTRRAQSDATHRCGKLVVAHPLSGNDLIALATMVYGPWPCRKVSRGCLCAGSRRLRGCSVRGHAGRRARAFPGQQVRTPRPELVRECGPNRQNAETEPGSHWLIPGAHDGNGVRAPAHALARLHTASARRYDGCGSVG